MRLFVGLALITVGTVATLTVMLAVAAVKRRLHRRGEQVDD